MPDPVASLEPLPFGGLITWRPALHNEDEVHGDHNVQDDDETISTPKQNWETPVTNG